MSRFEVHAFVGAGTRDGLARALANPRLARADAAVVAGGLAEATARYAGQPSPPVIVIEVPAVPGGAAGPAAQALFRAIGALAEVCDAGSDLVLLGPDNDVDLYRALRRLGVAEYLRLPLDPLLAAEAVAELVSGPAPGRRGQVLAVLGAKGGCGASTLALNLAYLLSRAPGCDALLADLDLQFGAADLGLGLDAAGGLRDLLAEAGPADEAVVGRFAATYDDRLRLLASPHSLDAAGRLDPDRLEAVVEALRRQARWTVLDLPRAWSAGVQRALRAADQVLVATPVDLAAVRNCRNLLDWLAAERPGLPTPLVAVCGCGGDRRPVLDPAEFCAALGLKRPFLVPGDQATLRLAASAGRTVAEVRPRSALAMSLGALAAAVAGPAAAPPPAGPVRRLLSALRRG